MSRLEEKIAEVQHLEQKGYNYDQIQCAALMVIADELYEMNAMNANAEEPEELTGLDKPSLSKADADD